MKKKKKKRKESISMNSSSSSSSISPSNKSSKQSTLPSSLPSMSTSTSTSIFCNLPKDLTSPSHLKWHKQYVPASSTPIYHPCRIVPAPVPAPVPIKNKSKRKRILQRKRKRNGNCNSLYSSSDSSCNSDNDSDSDSNSDSSEEEEEEVTIEYISNLLNNNIHDKKLSNSSSSSSSSLSIKYKTISRKRLIPYHNQNQSSMDYNDITSSQWCSQVYNLYKTQQQKKQLQQNSKHYCQSMMTNSNNTNNNTSRNKHKQKHKRKYNNRRSLQSRPFHSLHDQDSDNDSDNASFKGIINGNDNSYHNGNSKNNYKNDMGLIELSFLNDVLTIAKQRAGYNVNSTKNGNTYTDTSATNHKNRNDSKDCSDKDSDEDDELIEPYDDLEEPYTQAIDYKAMGYNSSDEEMEEFFREIKKKPSQSHDNSNNNNTSYRGVCSHTDKHTNSTNSSNNNNSSGNYFCNKEPIKPGDVIEYYNPIFVFGDERGKRITTVISVDPKVKHSILKLSNAECLPKDTKIRRTKTLIEDHDRNRKRQKKSNENNSTIASTSSVTRLLIEHPGIFREIQEFKLVKLNPIKGYHIQTEQERVKSILQTNMKKFRKKVEASGFAPMDMMYDFGTGKNVGKDGQSNSKDNCDDGYVGKEEQMQKVKTSNQKNDTSSLSSDSDGDLLVTQEVRFENNIQIPSPVAAIKQRRFGKGIHKTKSPPQPSSSFQRKVKPREKTKSKNKKSLRADISKDDNLSSDDDDDDDDGDEVLRKLNNHYKSIQIGREINCTSLKAQKGRHSIGGMNGNKAIQSCLSLRDTDDEDDDEDLFLSESRRAPPQLEDQTKSTASAISFLYHNEDSDEEIQRKPSIDEDVCMELTNRDNASLLSLSSDSDDDDLPTASFPKGRGTNEKNISSAHRKQSVIPSPITNSNSPTKNTSIKEGRVDSFVDLDFHSSDSNESISSSSGGESDRSTEQRRMFQNSLKHKSNNTKRYKIQASIGGGPRVVNKTNYRIDSNYKNSGKRKEFSPKPIRVDKSRFGLNQTSKGQLNLKGQIPSVKPLTFKLRKHN